MNFFLKKVWKGRNAVEAFYQSVFLGGNGALKHRKDKRDYIFDEFGSVIKSGIDLTFNNNWVFDQKKLNICVFAQQAIGDSHQEGVRFSVKFYVKLAKKLGYINGNGFSFLRASLKIATKYGRLPYEYMPDEVDESWEDYSKYDITDEHLRIAKKYKAPAYRLVKDFNGAVSALNNGLVLHTANKWYKKMNKPVPDKFRLEVGGSYIGGHAWCVTGYNVQKSVFEDFDVLQSFGKSYGNNGYAAIEKLFQKNNYPVYILEKII